MPLQVDGSSDPALSATERPDGSNLQRVSSADPQRGPKTGSLSEQKKAKSAETHEADAVG